MVFVAPRYPYPPERGDQRRVLHLLKGLARHFDIDLVCFGSGPPLPFPGVRVAHIQRTPGAVLAANVRHPDPRLPVQTRLYLDRRMVNEVSDAIARSRPSVIHITLSRLGAYLPVAGPAHRHIDLVDALSVNMASRATATSWPLRFPLQLEARLIGRYESVLACQADTYSLVAEADRRAARGLGSAAIIPNGVDPEEFPYRPPVERSARLVFFGNLGYFHNVEPARFLACEVLPRVRGEIPDATLALVGYRPAAALRSLATLPGVDLVGPVDRMCDELHRGAVAVLPMFSGSGVKNKVLEAFSAGTPVVTNTLGIAGVAGANRGEHHVAAEGPSGLAAACVDLIRHPEKGLAISANARRLVQDRYSWDAQVAALMTLYRSGKRFMG